MEGRLINLPSGLPGAKVSALTDSSVLQISGGHSLHGHVEISGAKNSALVIMAGALLCSEDCRIRNVPLLADVEKMGQVLSALGISLKRHGDVLDINASEIKTSKAPYELVTQLRASFFAIGAILARLGVAQMPLPGGCAIGARPVDLHVRGLQAMGAEVQIEHGICNAYIPKSRRRLKGAKIYLDSPSVGATETLMMAATLAEGETIIGNAAREPEVFDLANFCISMGAKIKGAGTSTIIIDGVTKLYSTEHTIIPDRIEAGTFLIAGAITHSELLLSPVVTEHLLPVIAKLREMGVHLIEEPPNCLRVLPAKALRATDIETLPHPGFPTDMQAPFMSLLTLAEGDSLINESVFENRLRHASELNRLGADIRVKGNTAFVRGVPMLSGAPVLCTDLRAAAALVLAGLAAQGKTVIHGLHHLDRGYDQLDVKLQNLGAKIRRLTSTGRDQEFMSNVNTTPAKITRK
ncbi:UDP-N-acetylglucosamine 1-carboxyvinyltransferase [Richelia intracellularis HH01]|mgnify:CR=1 FL=1|uniref:UDP-N-acetylglucosamine 1-carboxyvinyltransferase n=1 Tax=Richelia intracellularis HH01 TaxID=1165094 RepID=M1X4W1_9NOST|nr:UDP-N-acetylglucosamine 1-carboxyvinyltransferase [Richelia intracellularis]CCH66781.1 UDP-N-acetylglucosamine 1-carboxyvinyltransferase [Richelia intracellularis HH01]HAE06137.1 UDP-N-acetylglucosamine 1-carboxyvinyltransferase [Richelia sp.]